MPIILMLFMLAVAVSPAAAAVLPGDTNTGDVGHVAFYPQTPARSVEKEGAFFQPSTVPVTTLTEMKTASVPVTANSRNVGFFPWGVRGTILYVDLGASLLGLISEQGMPGTFPSFPVTAKVGYEFTFLGLASLNCDLSFNSFSYIEGKSDRAVCITGEIGADIRLYPLFFLEPAAGFWISGGAGFASGLTPPDVAGMKFLTLGENIVPEIPVIRFGAGYKILLKRFDVDPWVGYEYCYQAPRLSGIRLGVSFGYH
jgi:hypothetical protein